MTAPPESAPLPEYEPHDPEIFEETDLDAEIQALHHQRQEQKGELHHNQYSVDVEDDENDDTPKWKRNLQSLGCIAASSPKPSPSRNTNKTSSATSSASTSPPDPFQEEDEDEDEIQRQIEEEAKDSGCLPGLRGRRKPQKEKQEHRGSSQWEFSFQAAQQQLSTVEEVQDESSVMSKLSSAPASVAGSHHANKDPLALGKTKVPPPPVPEEIMSASPITSSNKTSSGSND